MPPTYHISVKSPVNGSDFVIYLTNLTSHHNGTMKDKSYDHEGAMKFIIATLLVYSLMGIVGLLLLKIRRRRLRSHRTGSGKEENVQRYIKDVDTIKMTGHREILMMKTLRTAIYVKQLERQKSTSASVDAQDSQNGDQRNSLLERSSSDDNPSVMSSSSSNDAPCQEIYQCGRFSLTPVPENNSSDVITKPSVAPSRSGQHNLTSALQDGR